MPKLSQYHGNDWLYAIQMSQVWPGDLMLSKQDAWYCPICGDIGESNTCCSCVFEEEEDLESEARINWSRENLL